MKLNKNQKSNITTAALTALIMTHGLATRGQTSNNETNATTKLADVVVRSEQEPERSYGTTNATSALKSDIPLLQTPQAISVVPRTLLDDQGVRKLEEALRNVAGVTPGGYFADWDYYRIRGFDAAFNTFWDGLRGDYGANVETFGLERVEVVKGPASSLYGQVPLGGLVNVISKRPRPERFADVQFTLGSYNFYEPAVDMGAPLNGDKTVYARLTALYRDQESFVDFVDKQRAFVAPAVTWEIGPDTALTFLSQYVHDWGHLGFPLPEVGTVLPNPHGEIPIERFVGEPGSNEFEQWRARLGYEFRHRFNDIFSVRQNLSVSRMWQDWNDFLYPWSLDADQRTLNRYPFSLREELDRLGVDTALEAKFETGPIEHHMIGGVDYYRNKSDAIWDEVDYTADPSIITTPIDVFDPVYGGAIPPYASSRPVKSENSFTGVYLQEHARLFERLTLVAGGRFDWSESGDDSVDAFTPRAGISYELVKGVAAYVNYSESFSPQWFARNASGELLDPETGENFEIGLKTSLLDGRLNTLLAVYHLTRQNVATGFGVPGAGITKAAGEQRSRGVEVEGAFAIMPGWDLTAAYSYTDAEITKDDDLQTSLRLAGVPEHAFSAWMKYTLQDGPLRGLGLGIGGRYYTAQEADQTYTNPFELPAYGLMDAAVYYRRGRLHAQVNVNNVLDERHFVGSYTRLWVLPGEPLNVRATVGWIF